MSAFRINTVRRLLKLAAVGASTEAEVARLRAAEIMSRHGITAEDVTANDEVELVLDVKRDFYREELARAISASRELGGAYARQQSIYLRGPKNAVANARDLYQTLVKHAEQGASEPDAHAKLDPDPVVRRLWRACFWMGFVRTVAERLNKERQKVPTIQVQSNDPDPLAAERAKAAAGEILGAIEMLPPGEALPIKDRALAAGGSEGWVVPIPSWAPRSRPRGLLPVGTCPECPGCHNARQAEVERLKQVDRVHLEEINRLKRRVEALSEYEEDTEEGEAEEDRLRQSVARLERELSVAKADLVEARREVANLQTSLRALVEIPPIDGLDLDLDVDLDDVRDARRY